MTTAAPHAEKAEDFLADAPHAAWHNTAVWFVRRKRDKATQAIPEWEALRALAERIKTHTIARMPEYLEAFERNARARGIEVHWASNAAEHNQIVHGILSAAGAQRVVKSKSMLTEECHLNHYLEERGIEIVDTDLGERIVQLRHEPPSHIVLPAIHLKKEQVGELFHTCMGTEKDCSDPRTLADAARMELRKNFYAAQAAITGVNFAIAETGGVVVCTNEGNADLGTALPPLHIACMGMEKLIPRAADLGVFTRLLARSATGQPVTAYTSHFHGPRPGGQMHIVIVDNGRSKLRGRPAFRRSLGCIRCGACLNTCPVYRRSGGFSYSATIPGPIGSVLSPAADLRANKSLPFASSLCGSCTDVCPVKIDLHHQLLAWRGVITEAGQLGQPKRVGLWAMGKLLGMRRVYELGGWMMRIALRLPRPFVYNPLNIWGRQRDLPPPPAESFRAWYRRREKAKQEKAKP